MVRQRSFGFVGLLAVLLVLRVLVSDAFRAAVAPSGLYAIDFRAYYAAADDLRHGRPIYAPSHDADVLYNDKRYVYPPLLAVALRPLARLDVDRAFRGWVAANLLLVAGGTAVFAAAGRAGRPLRVAPLVLFLVMAFRFWPTSVELAIGQADVLLFAAVCGLYAAEARGRTWATCGLIVAAALVKPWALSLLFVLVARRAWVAVAATVVAYAAALAALFAIVGGTGPFHAYLDTVRSFAYQPMLVSHSVQGAAKLLFTAGSGVRPLVVSRVLYYAVVVVGYAAVLYGLGLAWRAAGRDRSATRRAVTLDVAVVATLLGLTVCHMWYFVLVLPVLWRLVGDGFDPGGRRLPAVVGLAVYLALASPFPGVSPIPDAARHGWRLATVLTPFVAAVVLWATLLVETARIRPAIAADPVEPGPAA